MSAGYLQLIELVVIFGGVLAFGWWQLRSVERDRQARVEAERDTEGEKSQAEDIAKWQHKEWAWAKEIAGAREEEP